MFFLYDYFVLYLISVFRIEFMENKIESDYDF